MSSKAPETTDDSNRSQGSSATRRRVLGGAAALGATAFAGRASADLAQLVSPKTEAVSFEQAAKEDETKSQNADIDVLNYALTLEHLEATFYREGLKEFSEDELMEAKALDTFGETIRMEVPTYLKTIGEHEAAHVKALTKTIKKLGSEPVSEDKYEFPYKNANQFLKIAMALENTGVAAYIGAAPTVSNDKVFKQPQRSRASKPVTPVTSTNSTENCRSRMQLMRASRWKKSQRSPASSSSRTNAIVQPTKINFFRNSLYRCVVPGATLYD